MRKLHLLLAQIAAVLVVAVLFKQITPITGYRITVAILIVDWVASFANKHANIFGLPGRVVLLPAERASRARGAHTRFAASAVPAEPVVRLTRSPAARSCRGPQDIAARGFMAPDLNVGTVPASESVACS
jgi:hypothetical protein